MEAFFVNPATGGLDMSTAPALVKPGSFVIAENVEYDISGSKKKRLGTNRYNATTLGASATIGAVADFWRHGAGMTPAQKFVAIAEDTIYKDDGDGVWDVVEAAWSAANRETTQNIIIGQGYALFSDGTAAPRKWDQSADSALANAPVYTYGVYYLRRLFVSGIAANPSRVDYCAAGDIETWSGADAGNFIFNEDDGDRVTGISKPFFGRLYVFKGPNKGGVHAIAGVTPTTFTRSEIISGAPCVAHKSIVTTPNDVYWVSPYGIHSLQATQKYGDTEEAFLSRPIQAEFNRANFARLDQVCSFYAPHRNIVGWAIPTGSSATNDKVFVYNYALDKWSIWMHSGLDVASAMTAREPSATNTGKPRLWLGSYGGFLYDADRTVLADENALQSYNYRLRSPAHYRLSDRATELHEKQFHSVCSFVRPTGVYTAQLSTTVDGRNQTAALDLSAGGGADLIGTTFVIGVSLIGSGSEASYIETPIEERGRSIQLEWSLSGVDQNMELYGYAIRYEPGEFVAMERS